VLGQKKMPGFVKMSGSTSVQCFAGNADQARLQGWDLWLTRKVGQNQARACTLTDDFWNKLSKISVWKHGGNVGKKRKAEEAAEYHSVHEISQKNIEIAALMKKCEDLQQQVDSFKAEKQQTKGSEPMELSLEEEEEEAGAEDDDDKMSRMDDNSNEEDAAVNAAVTEQEIEACLSYAGNGHKAMNIFKRLADESVIEHTKNFETLIRKIIEGVEHESLKKYNPGTEMLYRGIALKVFREFKAHDRGFLSCSRGAPFERNCLVVYPPSLQHCDGVDLCRLSQHPHEAEVVFAPGSQSTAVWVWERDEDFALYDEAADMLETDFDFVRTAVKTFDSLLKVVAPSSYHKVKYFEPVDFIVIASLEQRG
jgi:hypothetical protein